MFWHMQVPEHCPDLCAQVPPLRPGRHILDPLSSERFRVLSQCPAQSGNAEH